MNRFYHWLRYNFWYLRKPPWDTGISPPELLKFIAETPPGMALELGCGTGVNCLALASAGWQVTGVDFALEAVRRARRRVLDANARVDLIWGDVTSLRNFPSPFDLVLDIGCFHNLSPAGKQKYLARLPGMLGLGGSWLVYGFLAQDGSGVDPAFGIALSHITQAGQTLKLVSRSDGTERGIHPSTWLHFIKDISH
jgi:SAM-dependent methyltransferase